MIHEAFLTRTENALGAIRAALFQYVTDQSVPFYLPALKLSPDMPPGLWVEIASRDHNIEQVLALHQALLPEKSGREIFSVTRRT